MSMDETREKDFPCGCRLGAPGEADTVCELHAGDDEPDTADTCDHACGECGRGLPSWQTHGSLCSTCLDEVRREAGAEPYYVDAATQTGMYDGW